LSSDAELLQRARAEIFEKQRQRAVERRKEKLEASEHDTAWELFIDTAKAEGLDENNPRDAAIILRAWLTKIGEPVDDKPRDWDGSPEVDLTF
jgi:hypothetical protein